MTGDALPYHRRPTDTTPVHTEDLPALPTRDRNIPATAWVEAPEALLRLGDDFDGPPADYKRRIHGWLLWRSGPATKADAAYAAIAADDLTVIHTFRLFAAGDVAGTGPSGEDHASFRSWKEDLRDHPRQSGGG